MFRVFELLFPNEPMVFSAVAEKVSPEPPKMIPFGEETLWFLPPKIIDLEPVTFALYVLNARPN